MNVPTTHAIQALFAAINHGEDMPADLQKEYFASFNFSKLINDAVAHCKEGDELTQVASLKNSAGTNIDKLWAACIRLLGLNLEVLRRERFQARQAAARKLAGIAERQRKNQVVSKIVYLFCPDQITAAFAINKYLPAPRAEFWLQKSIRQECWIAASDLVRDYVDDNRHYLISTLARCNSALNGNALTAAESALNGEQLTNGGFGIRKQFWKFVSYHIDSILPKDLAVIIDIQKAIDRETHATDHVTAAAEA